MEDLISQQPNPPSPPPDPDPPKIQQAYFGYESLGKKWREIDGDEPVTSPPFNMAHRCREPPRLQLITWKISSHLEEPVARMSQALSHLGDHAAETPDECPLRLVIMLQDITAAQLEVIKRTTWVQERYYLATTDNLWMKRETGPVTLINTWLPILKVFSIQNQKLDPTQQTLFVDVSHSVRHSYVRLGNVHFDSSMFGMFGIREEQLRKTMTVYIEPPNSFILAGDFETYDQSDETVLRETVLRDSCPPGRDMYTWGFHSTPGPDQERILIRKDRVLYSGHLSSRFIHEVGVYLEYGREDGSQSAGQLSSPRFVSEHRGLRVYFDLLDYDPN